MSRIGNKTITIPSGVTVTLNGNNIVVAGPKGTLNVTLNHGISFEEKDNVLTFKRANDEKQIKQNHGTVRANVANAIKGVTEGYKIELTMIGIGYKAQLKGSSIEIWAGYSHTTVIDPLPGVKISVADLVNITVEGIDKQAVGEIAARIRAVRSPEPYLGKGIRYKDEHVVTKEGKRAAGKK